MQVVKYAVLLGLISAGMLHGTASQAIVAPPETQTFYITMDCSDCALEAGTGNFPVSAEITLSNYFLGDPLDISNFASFKYSGSNLVDSYAITELGNATTVNNFLTSTIYTFAGAITNPSGANELAIEFDDGLHFRTHDNGDWSTCAPGGGSYYGGNSCFSIANTDFGTGAGYSTTAPVPEPSHLALMAAGLALVAGVIRRAKRV